ncbi:MAG: transglycosylase SLT domain-containing protein [Xanthobacteraceae bacterium]|nr:transglycosylase SLT domain-containing protein [Xanthobacteraceae bacterium]MBX3533048.1 transglycosylase SLT domain-containing protein [Xanthobacteraceae bacterium]MCW5677404.1 transglycosylase SLT domain-containing protein [Xanthobacteraceae bacterium]
MRPRLGRVIAAIILAATLFVPASHAQSAGDAATIKKIIAQLKDGDFAQATSLSTNLSDPVARDLMTWLAIRYTPKDVGFDRTQDFIRRHPNWPSMVLIKRRAENLLLSEKRDPKEILGYFGSSQPVSGEGMVALARALLASGNQAHAVPWLRRAWREEELSMTLEQEIIGQSGNLLNAADHKARADRLFYLEKFEAAQRNAERAGKDFAALSRARNAALQRNGNANALLNAVPASQRKDPSYLYARAYLKRRGDDPKAAAQLLLQAPRIAANTPDADDWWRERRLVVRALLDDKQYQLAYRVAAAAALPENDILKADIHFTAGWVALRYLKDAATAKKHFVQDVGTSQPFYVARALYWQGRAAEALHDAIGARAAYTLAARHHLAFYGQLARAKLNMHQLPFRAMPSASDAERHAFNANPVSRVLKLLYEADADDLVIPVHMDMIDRTPTAATAALLAEVASAHKDTRALVIIGKQGLDRGLPVDAIAFPLTGIPTYNHLGPPIEKALVYAISRQESEFQPYVVSPAKAYGLMQVIRPTGAAIAKRIGIAFSFDRLQGDPVYNVTLGSAELGQLIQNFNGSYVLTFIGYNAGPGRSRQWMNARGDPRGGQTEAIVDWIERIPFTETRLYVLRVLENLQVYRALLTKKHIIEIETDLARGSNAG